MTASASHGRPMVARSRRFGSGGLGYVRRFRAIGSPTCIRHTDSRWARIRTGTRSGRKLGRRAKAEHSHWGKL